jgi:hypothetical protein
LPTDGALPRLPGALAVNFGRRMNQCLEVNERFAYAQVDPGGAQRRSA